MSVMSVMSNYPFPFKRILSLEQYACLRLLKQVGTPTNALEEFLTGMRMTEESHNYKTKEYRFTELVIRRHAGAIVAACEWDQ